jgi:hypothetical protein
MYWMLPFSVAVLADQQSGMQSVCLEYCTVWMLIRLLCFLLQGANPLIFLINNGGYTIEVEIHDGPYNVIHTWCDPEVMLSRRCEAKLVTRLQFVVTRVRTSCLQGLRGIGQSS